LGCEFDGVSCVEGPASYCGDGNCAGISEEKTLNNNEIMNVNFNGISYIVEALVTDFNEVRFTVNGETTNILDRGDSFQFSTGLMIYVVDITYSAYVGGEQSVDFFVGEDYRSCSVDCGILSEAWQVKTSSDNLELNEPVSNVLSYIDKDDLPTLGDGEIANEKGLAKYEQFLYFDDITSSMVSYQEDDDENIGLFYKVVSGEVIARYVMDFTTNLKSDIIGNVLEDIEGEDITLIGKTYEITSATINSSSVNLILSGEDQIKLNDGSRMIVNGEWVNNAEVTILSTSSGGEVAISQIAIRMTAEDDLYVPVNSKLSEAADLDEPEVLVTQNWDILFSGLKDIEYEEFSINKATDSKMRLNFLNYNGNEIEFPLVYSNASEIFLGEKAGYGLLLNPQVTAITKNDYFILNTADPIIPGNNARSFVVQYKGADKITDYDPKCKFNVLGVDSNKEVSLSSQGTCMLRLGGVDFIVENATNPNVEDFSIKLISSGDYSDTNGATLSNYVRTKHNALIKISDSNINSNTDAITIELIIDDTTRDGDEYTVTTPDQIFTVSFMSNSNQEIATNYSGGDFNRWIADPDDYTTYTYIDTYGNNIEYNNPTGSLASVTVMIPESIVEPRVFIT